MPGAIDDEKLHEEMHRKGDNADGALGALSGRPFCKHERVDDDCGDWMVGALLIRRRVRGRIGRLLWGFWGEGLVELEGVGRGVVGVVWAGRGLAGLWLLRGLARGLLARLWARGLLRVRRGGLGWGRRLPWGLGWLRQMRA